MKTWVFFVFLIVPLVSKGQFNSVTLHNPVQERPVTAKGSNRLTMSSPDQKGTAVNSIPIPAFDKEGESPDSALQRLKGEYISVCPPLKHITVTSGYGYRQDPFHPKKRSFHKGLDLRASYEPVYSMFPGRVIEAGFDKRSGNHVTVRHGDYRISYCHLSRIDVSQGDSLLAGDILGISGNSGHSTGPHLHLTCKRNSKTEDPALVILYICNVRTRALQGMTELLN